MKNRYIAVLLFAVVSLMNCALQAKDDFAENYNYKRALEFWNEDKAKAKDWLLREIEATPQNGLAFYRLSAIYRMEGDMKKAIETSTQAINLLKKDPDMLPFSYLERALEYCLSADTTSALSDLSVGIRLNPKSAELYECFGGLLIDVQRFFEAKMYIQKGIGFNPTSTEGYLNQGRLCYVTGELDESINAYNNAFKFAEVTPWLYIGRAETLIKKGHLGAAADDLLDALAADKDNAKALSLIQQIADQSYQLMQIKLKARRMKDSENSYWNELSNKVKAYKDQKQALYDKNASLKAPVKDYMMCFDVQPAAKEAAPASVEFPGADLYKKELLSKNSVKVEVKPYIEKSAKDETVLSPEHITPYALSVVWQQ